MKRQRAGFLFASYKTDDFRSGDGVSENGNVHVRFFDLLDYSTRTRLRDLSTTIDIQPINFMIINYYFFSSKSRKFSSYELELVNR